MAWKKQHISLKTIEEEYLGDSIKDDDRMFKLKSIISDNLDETDRALLIVYADEESMAKTAKKFNVSPATIYFNIKRIRKIITEKL